MYKLLAAAILSVFLLAGILLFAPGTSHKKQTHKKNTKIENNNQTNIFQTKDNSSNLTNSNFEKINDLSLSQNTDQPRNDASSHGMDEKFFAYFDKNQYHTMKMNLQEKMTSHSDSIVKSKKAQKNYDKENDI